MIKNRLKYFSINWLCGFLLFNLAIFVTPNQIGGVYRFNKPVFWISYGFIVLSFLAQLIISILFCKNDISEKMFLRIPLLKYGYIMVWISVIVGSVFLIIPVFPEWIAIIICAVLTIAYIAGIVKRDVAAKAVENVGEQVKNLTSFMKNITDEVFLLMDNARGEEKNAIRRVYEELKYSDFVSSPSLSEVENSIEVHVCILKKSVSDEDSIKISEEIDTLMHLIKERNTLCKKYK